jgi:osmotically-inducible protein OsmY
MQRATNAANAHDHRPPGPQCVMRSARSWNGNCEVATVQSKKPTGRQTAIAFAIASGVAGAGCGASHPSPVIAVAPPTPPSPPRAAPGPATASDTRVVAVLLRELEADAVTRRERIEVDCASGVLTLKGSVASRLAKERAVAVAQIVRGVRAIIDRVTVAEAPPRPDYAMEFMAAGALAADPAVASEAIGAHAHGGVVRLSGNVDSIAARRIAESDVLALPGVTEVADDLAVAPGERPDARIESAVRRVMRDDPWLDDARLRVTVRDGVVRIRGVVNSATERSRAEADAGACTPRSVDVVALRVVEASDGTLRDDPSPYRADGDLANALRDAEARDPRVRPFLPTFDVRSAVVVMTGDAPDADAARAASEDARNLPGIADTHIDIRVAPPAEHSDANVLYGVRDSIARDPHLAARGITVDVFHGRILLRGTVDSEADRRHAVAAATGAPGSQGVDDELLVAPRIASP